METVNYTFRNHLLWEIQKKEMFKSDLNGKRWINETMDQSSLEDKKTGTEQGIAEDTCRALPSIFDKAEKGRNSHEKQKEQEGVKIESYTGKVDIVPLGQRKQTNQEKLNNSHLSKRVAPLPFSAHSCTVSPLVLMCLIREELSSPQKKTTCLFLLGYFSVKLAT